MNVMNYFIGQIIYLKAIHYTFSIKPMIFFDKMLKMDYVEKSPKEGSFRHQ